MSRLFHPLLYLLACATRQELARQEAKRRELEEAQLAKMRNERNPEHFRR